MLIDWLSFDLPYVAARVFSQQFEKPWDSDIITPKRIAAHRVEGSYSTWIQVIAADGRLTVSGNPVKLFSGQNIIGSADLQELVLLTYEYVLLACNIPDCQEARKAILDGDVNITRVDVTDHLDVGTDDDVRVFLQALGDRATITKRGRGHFNSDFCSVGWGFGNDLSNGEKRNGSRRSTLKFYNKLEEVKRRPMTCPDRVRQLLLEWVEGKVRVEACFRGMELKRLGYKSSKDWDEGTPRVLLDTFLTRLVVPDQVTLMEDVTAEMPRALRGTFEIWRSGSDVKSLMAKNTFYRHRRQLLEYGIDISLRPQEPEKQGRVLHLIEILRATPAQFPNEAVYSELALDGFERLAEAAKRRNAA